MGSVRNFLWEGKPKKDPHNEEKDHPGDEYVFPVEWARAYSCPNCGAYNIAQYLTSHLELVPQSTQCASS